MASVAQSRHLHHTYRTVRLPLREDFPLEISHSARPGTPVQTTRPAGEPDRFSDYFLKFLALQSKVCVAVRHAHA